MERREALLEISDDARELILARLKDALQGRPDLKRGNSTVGLRLNFGRGGAYLSLAFPRTTDEVISYMGRPLLIVDRHDVNRLEEICLTVEQGTTGSVVLSMVPRVANPA